MSSTLQKESADTAAAPVIGDYVALKRLITDQRLLEPQPRYYALKFAIAAALLAAAIVLLVLVHDFWLRMLDAVFMAFAFGQIAFLGHDTGHYQVFRTRRGFAIGGYVIGNLVAGWSWTWWIDRHNRHHGKPNQIDIDPDIAIPLLAFSESEARSREGFARWMVKRQAYLFLPLELLGNVVFLVQSIQFLLQRRANHPEAELSVMALNAVLYLGLLVGLMGVWQALAFVVVHRALLGLYLGSVAAPNHKGMPVLEPGTRLDFLRAQVLTARNVAPNWFTDIWYGGLNYQIEHHLFPTMPRNNLCQARKIVRDFCAEHSIPYHESAMGRSYVEIFQHLRSVSESLKAQPAIA